jgi:hypothetical protein
MLTDDGGSEVVTLLSLVELELGQAVKTSVKAIHANDVMRFFIVCYSIQENNTIKRYF